MIRHFTDFDEFEKAAAKIRGVRSLRELLGIDLNFLESYDNFTIVNLKDAFQDAKPEGDLNNILILSKKASLLFSARKFPKAELSFHRKLLRENYGESTVLCLISLKDVLANYSLFFERLRRNFSEAEKALDYEGLNRITRSMRKLEDKLSDFLRMLIELEDKKVRQVDTSLISYDYDILRAKARLLLDSTNLALGQINSEKREIELRSTNALNKNVEFLSKMMMVLTLVGVVVSVPGSLGAFFGIPAISDITPVPTILFWVWVPTCIAALISYLYWRKLEQERRQIIFLVPFSKAYNLVKNIREGIIKALKD